MVNNKNNLNRIKNNSQNFKNLGNQNLLDTHKNRFVFNYLSQDNNLMLIYKHCGDKRLNSVANLLKFVSENRRYKN